MEGNIKLTGPSRIHVKSAPASNANCRIEIVAVVASQGNYRVSLARNAVPLLVQVESLRAELAVETRLLSLVLAVWVGVLADQPVIEALQLIA